VGVVLGLLVVLEGVPLVRDVLVVLFLHFDHHRFMLSFATENAEHRHTDYDQG
jgi:hypothetical protein